MSGECAVLRRLNACPMQTKADALKAERDDYRKALEKVLPDVIALAEQNIGMVNDMTDRDDAYEHPECVCIIKTALAQGSLINDTTACPIDDQPCHPATCTFGKRDCTCKERNGIKEEPK